MQLLPTLVDTIKQRRKLIKQASWEFVDLSRARRYAAVCTHAPGLVLVEYILAIVRSERTDGRTDGRMLVRS